MTRVLFATPSWRPVGGVVKVMDYVLHAQAEGFDVQIWCPKPLRRQDPIWKIERLGGLRHIRIESTLPDRVGPDTYVLISWPTHHDLFWPLLAGEGGNRRLIHFVQNVRHANPLWLKGYAARLLTRPMPRIMTNTVVLEACKPFLNADRPTRTINLGHPSGYFSRARVQDSGPRLRVGYTTWKSKVGDEVADLLSDDHGYEFRAIREEVPWKTLRALYHWCDIFLCCPNVEEGFYMPGLEAMEAGCLIVTPDVGGNMAYVRFGTNALEADFDDPLSYVAALRQLGVMCDGDRRQMIEHAQRAPDSFTLEGEQRQFGVFLRDLEGGG